VSLSEVVDLQITSSSSTITREGFGTILLMVYHSVTVSALASYKSVKAITDAGFPLTHPAVKMATRAFSQNPRPQQVMIGKRLAAFTQTIEVVPVITTQGYHYVFTVVAPDGTETNIDYTVLAAATVASICTALAALIDPVGDVTATAAATKITLACTAGKLFDLKNLPPPSHFKVKDVTADPGIAADLTAIETLDSKSWYGVVLDYGGKATTVAAAAWIEARRKILFADTTDTNCTDNADATDVCSALKDAAYARTATLFSQPHLLAYSALGWLANRLTTTPGAANWAFVTVAGVTVSTLLDAEIVNLRNKNCNTYTSIAGANSTLKGVSAAGEFVDNIHGTDWLHARMSERIFGVIKDASDRGSKIPYTNAGINVIKAAGLAQLQEGVDNGFLAADPAPEMSFPDVDDIDENDRAERLLPDGTFTARYANAINKIAISGAITV
jgi:hypothetical protein